MTTRREHGRYNLPTWQFFVTFLGWLSDPIQRLNDLQVGDKQVTLNHLADISLAGRTLSTQRIAREVQVLHLFIP